MKIVSWILVCAAACPAAACAAEGTLLMNTDVRLQNGVSVRFETRLEPGSPSFAEGFIGGNITDRVIHRYFAYNALHKFFGYDLRVIPGAKGVFEVSVQPLSIGPDRIEVPDPAKWSVIPLPAYPNPQTVREGDTLAIQMFTNPTTGQKITDYAFFPISGHPLLAAGDVIFVNVAGHPEMTGSLTVRDDGEVAIRFAGKVRAAGRTPSEIANEVGDRLKKYLPSPAEVNVQVIRAAHKYYVSGEVRRPGAYNLDGQKTVLEAIRDAGGPADFAKTKGIYILRGKEKFPFNYMDVVKGRNLEQNIVLKDGDVIVIP